MTIKVKKPEIKQNQIHLEQEEKPIVEALLKISEEFHGGDEVTQSVDDQRFALQQASQEQQNETEKEEAHEENETENQEQEGTQNEEGQKEENIEEGENEEEQKQNEENTKGYGEEQTEKQGEQKEQAKGQKDEEESEQEEREENEEENEDGEEQKEPENEKNSEQAFKLSGKGKLFLQLYRLIEYLQEEEKALTPEPSQTQALNIKKLIFRQFERKPLSSYYEYRERSEIILVLDTSGSMTWIKEALNTFFSVALKRKDIQVFIAPNGIIETTYDPKTKKFQEIEHENAMRTIIQSRLPVLYIGDFDGANTPVELSWHNKVFWVCTETRYKYFSEHDWVDYNEEQFKGFFGRAWNEKEIVLVLKEFAKHIMEPRFWLDLHKDEDFEEDEE